MIVHSASFKNILVSLNKRKKLSRFVFDEVHCMDSWGRDLRCVLILHFSKSSGSIDDSEKIICTAIFNL